MREDQAIYDLAYRSHSGTSFSPEKRAAQEVQEYFMILDQFKEWLERNAVEGIDQAAELERFTQNYNKALIAYLHARSRCLSTMICGPANFPVRRAEKANASSDNRMHELIDVPVRARKSIMKRVNKLIVVNAGGELAMARALLAEREKTHETMKKANAIIRKAPKYKKTEEKVKALQDLTFDCVAIEKLFGAGVCGYVGFQQFELTNSNARIKSTRQRVIDLLHRENATTTEIDTKSGFKVIENAEQNRLQLIFPGKPSATIRSLLKRNGFRWSPRNTAWQRQLTNNGKYALKNLLAQIDINETVTA